MLLLALQKPHIRYSARFSGILAGSLKVTRVFDCAHHFVMASEVVGLYSKGYDVIYLALSMSKIVLTYLKVQF